MGKKNYDCTNMTSEEQFNALLNLLDNEEVQPTEESNETKETDEEDTKETTQDNTKHSTSNTEDQSDDSDDEAGLSPFAKSIMGYSKHNKKKEKKKRKKERLNQASYLEGGSNFKPTPSPKVSIDKALSFLDLDEADDDSEVLDKQNIKLANDIVESITGQNPGMENLPPKESDSYQEYSLLKMNFLSNTLKILDIGTNPPKYKRLPVICKGDAMKDILDVIMTGIWALAKDNETIEMVKGHDVSELLSELSPEEYIVTNGYKIEVTKDSEFSLRYDPNTTVVVIDTIRMEDDSVLPIREIIRGNIRRNLVKTHENVHGTLIIDFDGKGTISSKSTGIKNINLSIYTTEAYEENDLTSNEAEKMIQDLLSTSEIDDPEPVIDDDKKADSVFEQAKTVKTEEYAAGNPIDENIWEKLYPETETGDVEHVKILPNQEVSLPNIDCNGKRIFLTVLKLKDCDRKIRTIAEFFPGSSDGTSPMYYLGEGSYISAIIPNVGIVQDEFIGSIDNDEHTFRVTTSGEVVYDYIEITLIKKKATMVVEQVIPENYQG